MAKTAKDIIHRFGMKVLGLAVDVANGDKTEVDLGLGYIAELDKCLKQLSDRIKSLEKTK